jgi:hypothetical protein
MAKKRTLEEEAVAAGERNVVPGQSWLTALIRGIGREMQGSQGTPFGQATREELGSLGYEQMLREQFPEEFARGRLYGSEMFPTDIASFYAARPGRSTFAPAMMAAEGRSAPMALEAPAARLAYTPVAEAPVAAAPRGSFDANMMAAFRRGEVGSRPAGRPQAYRPEDFLAIEQGPFAQSPNAFEGNMVLAQRRGMPSPSPANYDYQGPAMPGPMTNRPVSGFDRNMLDWARAGRTPPTRTGVFREGDFPPYSPEEMGQGMVPYRAQTQVAGMPPGEIPPSRGGPVGFQLLPPYREGAPYAEFRDVTGNVLTGPAGGAQSPLAGGFPYGKAAAIGAGIGLPAMMAYYGSQGQGPVAGVPAMDQGARGAQMLPPIDVYGRPMAGVMAAPATPAARAAPATTRGGKKAAPTPPRRPAEAPAEPAWEGNINYHVTRAIDALLGQNEAERGRQYQQYYEQNPY